MALNIPPSRLSNQHLLQSTHSTAKDVVNYMGAVQSQDYPAAKWALGLRIPESTDADIEKAFEKGTILRTHVMRPTWHFVSPKDIRWMEELTSPRVRTNISTYAQGLGVTPTMVSKSKVIIEKALQKQIYLTREEIGKELQRQVLMQKRKF